MREVTIQSNDVLLTSPLSKDVKEGRGAHMHIWESGPQAEVSSANVLRQLRVWGWSG